MTGVPALGFRRPQAGLLRLLDDEAVVQAYVVRQEEHCAVPQRVAAAPAVERPRIVVPMIEIALIDWQSVT